MAQRRHRPVIQLTLSPDAIARLDKITARLGIARSAWVEQVVRTAPMPHPSRAANTHEGSR
jgi:hypothetical protein